MNWKPHFKAGNKPEGVYVAQPGKVTRAYIMKPNLEGFRTKDNSLTASMFVFNSLRANRLLN